MSGIPLEVDSSILEKNLRLPGLDSFGLSGEESLESLLLGDKPPQGQDVVWKPVVPTPGYCVKLRTKEGDKVFVNVCHTLAIPPPKEISEQELMEIINSDDLPNFRIPISLGDLHIESDKSHNPCSVYDIAVNSSFYSKMEKSEVFNLFFLNVSIQALDEKYSLDFNLKNENPYVVLKNRKVLGKLQVHRIQQREIKKAPGELIQEVKSSGGEKKMIQIMEENGDKEEEDEKVDVRSTKMEKTKRQFQDDTSPENKGLETSYKTTSELASKLVKSGKLMEGSYLCEGDGEDPLAPLPISTVGNIHCKDFNNADLPNVSESGRNLILIRRFPVTGVPSYLEAIVHIDVESSNQLEIKLDESRLLINILNRGKAYLDVTLPFSIDVNKSFSYFIREKQKLIVQMGVISSLER